MNSASDRGLPPQARLRALVEKWRERRERVADKGMEIAGTKGAYECAGLCEALETCADDLETVLDGSVIVQERVRAGRPRSAGENDMNDLERGFHNRDGWYFRRDSDAGDVRIWKVRWEKRSEGQFEPVLEAGPHTIPENEWASIVASVSQKGESAESWQAVRDFHAGRGGVLPAAPSQDESRSLDGSVVPSEPPVGLSQQARLRALVEKWRGEAAVKDTFHATMGIGWKVCANDLETVLAESRSLDAQHNSVPPTMADAAEMLWVVLANVSGGDWTQQSAEWQEAAARWRDYYFAAVQGGSLPAPPERQP